MKFMMMSPMVVACLAATQSQPFVVSILLMMTSLAISLSLNYHLSMIWIPAILILTYSSGMMIMMMYVSSLIPTFYLKPNMKMMVLMLLVAFAMKVEKSKESYSMKEIYNNAFVNLMGIIILLALFTLSALAFEPQKPMQNCNYENKTKKK